MNHPEGLSSQILGQISLMQSVVAQLPDRESMLKFICRGLTDVDGVKRVAYEVSEENSQASEKGAGSNPGVRVFSINHKGTEHARLLIRLSDPYRFSPYIPFIENFTQMLAVIFEAQRQRDLNRDIRADLEKRVRERTRELELEIFEHKQSEEALRQSEKKYRMLIENLPQRIFYKDTNAVYVACNQNFADDMGIDPDKIFGKTDYDLFPESLAEKYRADDRRIIETGKTEEIEEAYIRDGRETIVRTVKTPVTDDQEKVIGILGIFWDITHQRQMEEQLRQSQKMESIGTMAGGIAHDFNNILGIILGNAELAYDDVPDWNPAKENLKEIRTASIRAREVIRQLLSFSRKSQQEQEPLKIVPILKESMKLIRASIPATIDIQPDIPDDSPAILADDTQIHQVIINLCSNAAHAMPGGGVLSVSLGVHQQGENANHFADLAPGAYLKLSVRDTGDGIDPSIVDKIFDPYFTTKPVNKGTGMGLAVVHGIVTNHNGRIYVESTPGQGSLFTVLLPVIDTYLEKSAETQTEPDRGKESVLVVDDEPSLVAIEQATLEKLGYRVEMATDPLGALSMIKSDVHRFDLVITDMTMPKMTGIELAQAILTLRRDLPLILCTGFNEAVSSEKASSLGFSGYIEKPVNRSDLARVVREVLDGKTTASLMSS